MDRFRWPAVLPVRSGTRSFPGNLFSLAVVECRNAARLANEQAKTKQRKNAERSPFQHKFEIERIHFKHTPSPRLRNTEHAARPSAVALPFGLFILTSRNSFAATNALVEHYSCINTR